MSHRSLNGEKGFLLRDGIFERFEPIGITWNDSYCRRIADAGPSGCFVERDLASGFGFEWKQCEDSPLDILDESNCPIIEQVPMESNPVRIELDDSLLDRFNELSEDELKDSFGTFTPAQSLNPYMTKFSMCSIEQAWLE